MSTAAGRAKRAANCSVQEPAMTLAGTALALVLVCGCSRAKAYGYDGEHDDGNDTVTVSTPSGVVQGARRRVPGYGGVLEFVGIPYAAPPVGPLRFAKPVARGRWSGVLDARRRPNACWQPVDTTFGDFRGSTMWNANTNMSEDCLYLNVWTPDVDSPEWIRGPSASLNDRRLPVMVWIHGGGFTSGSASRAVHDGRRLAAIGRVVVVAMNYRLGMLGFLAMPRRWSERQQAIRSGLPAGNAGLHDQAMALRWVASHVSDFGGDSHSVTLFGSSAGGACVTYHMLSAHRSLFHRVIVQSGTALSNWALMTSESARRRLEVAVGSSGCSAHLDRIRRAGGTDDDGAAHGSVPLDAELLSCLRRLPARDILEAQAAVTKGAGFAQYPFLPTVDDDLLWLEPSQLLRRSGYGGEQRHPLLIGSTADEGSAYVAYLDELESSFNTSDLAATVDRKALERLAIAAFRSYPQLPRDASRSDVDSIVRRYSDPLRPDDTLANVRALIAAVGDSRFLCSVNRWAALYAAGGAPTYYYLFDHVSSNKAWGHWTGAMHGDELDYVFGDPFLKQDRYSRKEQLLSKHVIALWTSFARTGNPTSGPMISNFVWPRYTVSDKKYYEISLESFDNPKFGNGPWDDRCRFLNECLSDSFEHPSGFGGHTTDEYRPPKFCLDSLTDDGGGQTAPLGTLTTCLLAAALCLRHFVHDSLVCV